MVWINDSNTAAINAQITDNIPANTSFVTNSLTCEARGTSTTSTCTFESANNRVFWQGTIGADLGATDEASASNELVITFRISVPSNINQVLNQASALTDTDGDGSFSDETTSASVAISNQADWNRASTATATPLPTATPSVLIIDPTLSKSLNPTQASIGQTVTYTLRVGNAGNTAANNVTVTDTLSSFLDIVQLTSTKGSTSFSGRTATFNIGTVNPNESITLTIQAQVNNTALNTADIPNTATLAHLSNNVTASENSNTVTLRIVGALTLPNTGEDSPPADSSWLTWLINLIVALGGLGLCVGGLYRVHHSDNNLTITIRQKRNAVSLSLGLISLCISMLCSLTTLGA